MSAPGEFGTVTSVRVTSAHESPRIAEAREHAAERVRRQRDTLRPMGWAVVLVVVAGAIGEQPHPAIQGKGLGVTLAVLAFAGALAIATGGRFNAVGFLVYSSPHAPLWAVREEQSAGRELLQRLWRVDRHAGGHCGG